MRAFVRFIIRLAILVFIAAFIVYVWPTRYRYDHVSYDGNTYPVRIDRITQDSDMLVPDQGWTPVEGEQNENGPETNQPTGHTAFRRPARTRIETTQATAARTAR